MVLLQTSNRVLMKECTDALLDSVAMCDWHTALIMVRALRFNVLIYCISHQISHEGIVVWVDKMHKSIKYGRRNDAKQRKFYAAYKGFIDAFSMEGKTIGKGKESLKKGIGDLISQVQLNFAELCTNGSPEHANAIRGDILELQRFSNDVAALKNEEMYNEYMMAVQEGMRFVSRVPGLLFQKETKNGKATWKMNTNFIPALSTDFAQFISLMERFHLHLDKPEAGESTGSGKGVAQTVGKPTEDERIDMLTRHAWNLLTRQEWKLSNIATHLNVTKKELAKWMNLPENLFENG